MGVDDSSYSDRRVSVGCTHHNRHQESRPEASQEDRTIPLWRWAADASLIPMNDLVQMLLEWFIIKITDNGDGTWMAETDYDGYIIPLVDQMFEINHANVIFIDDDTYQISDTKDITDSATIKIVDNGDGTWTATTSNPDLIYVDEDGSLSCTTQLWKSLTLGFVHPVRHSRLRRA